MNKKIKFIAEIGSNHNQNVLRIRNLIKEVSLAGFDGVKFQLFEPTLWANKKTQMEMSDFVLKREWVKILCKESHELGLQFGVSVFDFDAIKIAFDAKVDFIKIASYEILRLDLIKATRRNKKNEMPIHLSLGMTNNIEIFDAIDAAQGAYIRELILYHCCPKYPAKYNECELWKINKLCKKFDYEIGWSDHSVNEEIIFEAYTRGANIFELHVDLNDMRGQESQFGHCWSISKAENLISKFKEKIANEKKYDYTELRKKRTNPKTSKRP